MIPAIPPIPSIPSLGTAVPGVTQTGAASGSAAPNGGNGVSSDSFQNILGQAIDSLNGTTNKATDISLQAAAGKATAVDATVATTEAELATQLATAVTSKAVTSLNAIMNMPV